MANTNKDGQAIGRKGAQSRARLLEAARGLIASTPADKLNAKSIAQAAELASQTFYLYFDDVDEVLLCLSLEASNDTGEILAELDRPWDTGALADHAQRFVAAFYRYWDRHRAVLNVRNFRADSGQEVFVVARSDSAMPIVRKIAERISAAQPQGALSDRGALARAIIIYSAIERMAARYASMLAPESLSSDDLKQAEADILALLLAPSRGDVG